MKIKTAICTTDIQYAQRLTHYFQAHYYDRFNWNIFSEASYLEDFLSANDADVVLMGKEMKDVVDRSFLEGKGERVWAYLVDDMDEELPCDIHQIEKYSRADKIYRDLLEIYSHKTNIHLRNASIVNSKTEIYAFVSPAGGTGTSTVAIAMAQNYAKFEKVLYINLENIGVSQFVFEGENKNGFDEVIFALKSRRKVLELKVASSVSRDKSGVYFFRESKNVLDVLDLTQDDMKELLTVLQRMREYDKIILDVGNGLGKKDISAMMYAGRIVAVMENGEIYEEKLGKYTAALQAIETQKKADISAKIILFFNKVPKQTRLTQRQYRFRVAGGFPRIENGTYQGIIERLAEMEVIRNIK